MSSSRGLIQRDEYLGVDCVNGPGMEYPNWALVFTNYCIICKIKLLHLSVDYYQRCAHPKCMIKIVSKKEDQLFEEVY